MSATLAASQLPPLAEPDDWPDAPENAADVLAQVSGAIRAYCGWHVAPAATETRTFDAVGPDVRLPTLCLGTVDQVEAGSSAAPDEWTTVDPAGYWTEQDGWLHKLPEAPWSRWWQPRPTRRLRVSFTHGFDPIPDELAGITVALSQRAAAAPAGITSEQIGMVKVTYAGNAGLLIVTESPVLARYRLEPL